MEGHSNSDEFHEKLRRLVPTLVAELIQHRGTQVPSVADPSAKLEYHLLADAVYWDDEFQGFPSEIDDAFRMVLNHRTSLLAGEDGRFPDVWQTSKECFPQWVGFRPERCTANAEISDRIQRIRRVSEWRIKRWEAEPRNLESPEE